MIPRNEKNVIGYLQKHRCSPPVSFAPSAAIKMLWWISPQITPQTTTFPQKNSYLQENHPTASQRSHDQISCQDAEAKVRNRDRARRALIGIARSRTRARRRRRASGHDPVPVRACSGDSRRTRRSRGRILDFAGAVEVTRIVIIRIVLGLIQIVGVECPREPIDHTAHRIRSIRPVFRVSFDAFTAVAVPLIAHVVILSFDGLVAEIGVRDAGEVLQHAAADFRIWGGR